MYWGDNSVNCYSNCSDAGVCKSGWCHCEPGRWGIDCSRTKVSFRLWFTFWMPDPALSDFPLVIPMPLDAENALMSIGQWPACLQVRSLCCLCAGGLLPASAGGWARLPCIPHHCPPANCRKAFPQPRILHPQAYTQHRKAPSRSLRIYVQELPVTMNLVWPVVLRDGFFWYGECTVAVKHFAVD